MKIEVDVSDQSWGQLKQLTALGIYGRDVEEIVVRFIDKALIKLTDKREGKFLIQTRAK